MSGTGRRSSHNDMPSEHDVDVYDVLVVGAGMAGLGAARALLDARGELEVMVLEARERLGGRAHTDHRFAGFPVELGAEFIHGERSIVWKHVERLGLETVRWTKEEDSWVRLADGRRLNMLEARAADPALEVARSWHLPPSRPRRHESFGGYLRRLGFDHVRLDYVRRMYANAAGESLRFLDATSALEGLHRDLADGEQDHRILEGYGAVVEALGVGPEIFTGTIVTRIEWNQGGVVVHDHEGHVYRAHTALITLPLGVLQAGGVEFDPPLPESKERALAGLGMGPVAKLLYRFADTITPDEITAVYAAGNPPMWWSPSAGHPTTEAVVWTALVTGDGAVELVRLGEADALERGLEALRRELGRPGLRPQASVVVDWTTDPFARGGYSHVRPGHHGARELLAEPTPPLYWAGEATAPEARAATVQGAILSGERAAAEILRALDERTEVLNAASLNPA
ncbi:MAG: NAD(P)/FAD-dependent oxidoreductase [Trueperaceae bacterium]|nr:NAD(P)/FAD-dependent oxidoreductase [Truepera sp.]HRN19268.1 NAD(P)/FAD-dependent oxidoreductase [Trueperaceae bacterium]HRQ11365.1 NAD(P)/FAD-dependent oxidoreductase [Trueperaceae bacterium]